MNEKLINRLRDVPCWAIGTETEEVMYDAASALEAADKRIAVLSLDNKMLKNTIDADKGVMLDRIRYLEAQLPKNGEWIRKEVKVYCPRDCWNPSACAIDGTWNEAEGWNLEMQDGFCSVCGEQDEEYYKHHYCPNCGAKMKKGEQE